MDDQVPSTAPPSYFESISIPEDVDTQPHPRSHPSSPLAITAYANSTSASGLNATTSTTDRSFIDTAAPYLRGTSISLAMFGSLLCPIGVMAASRARVVPGLAIIPLALSALTASIHLISLPHQISKSDISAATIGRYIFHAVVDFLLCLTNLGFMITVYAVAGRWGTSTVVLATWITVLMMGNVIIHAAFVCNIVPTLSRTLAIIRRNRRAKHAAMLESARTHASGRHGDRRRRRDVDDGRDGRTSSRSQRTHSIADSVSQRSNRSQVPSPKQSTSLLGTSVDDSDFEDNEQ